MKDPLLEQKRLLKMIPLGVWGVKVQDENGDFCFRDLASVLTTDVIQVKKDGEPITMVNKPGRKAVEKIEPQNAYAQALIQERDKSVTSNPIATSAQEDPDSLDVFNNLIKGMATGIAALEFEAEQAMRQGDSTVQILVKKMTAMRSTADLWIKRREQLSTRSIDMDSRAFKELFKFIMDTFRSALKISGIRQEKIENIFGNLSTLMNEEAGWVEEAKNKMKDL